MILISCVFHSMHHRLPNIGTLTESVAQAGGARARAGLQNGKTTVADGAANRFMGVFDRRKWVTVVVWGRL